MQMEILNRWNSKRMWSAAGRQSVDENWNIPFLARCIFTMTREGRTKKKDKHKQHLNTYIINDDGLNYLDGCSVFIVVDIVDNDDGDT